MAHNPRRSNKRFAYKRVPVDEPCPSKDRDGAGAKAGRGDLIVRKWKKRLKNPGAPGSRKKRAKPSREALDEEVLCK